MESNYGRGGVTSNEDVLRNFCTNTNEVKANNLSTHYDSYNDQVLLRQYGVLIATRKGDKLMITSKRYSVTTSKVQNELLRIAMEYGLDVQKTNEFAKGGKLGEDLQNYSDYDEFYDVVFEYIKREENLTEEEAKNICIVNESIIEAEFDSGSSPRFTGDVILGYLSNERGYMAKGGEVFGAEKFWNELSSKEKMEWLKKRRDIPSDYKSSLSRDSFENLPDWIKSKVKKAFADNKIYKYAKGGDIAQGNYEMMLSQAKEVEHHVNELQNILQGEKDIDAWVVAKMENVSSTLSDITHYLDGKTEYANGGKMSTGGLFGKDAIVKDLEDEFASPELLAKFRKKSGIKDTELKKPNVIAFAYTDYGGDFMDKVAIEYFIENHPKYIVFENSGYNGKNAIVWGKPAMDWVKATEDYILGYEDFESYYDDKVYKEEETAFADYIYELQDDGFELDFDIVLEWLLENKGGYYQVTTQGLDFYRDDLTNELLEEGLIEKSEEYAKGGNIKSKTNKKMATKKSKDGQSAPQTKRWIFAFNKGGYNYYNEEERPYKKPVDSNKKGAPVGYRFSKYAEEKGITNNRFRKPTKAEVEQYAGKKKNGKLIMYRETRSNKSDVNPKKKI